MTALQIVLMAIFGLLGAANVAKTIQAEWAMRSYP